MKLIRRLSLICCAIAVFINMALVGTLLASNSMSAHVGTKGQQMTFQKVVKDFNLNATEIEEDFELDSDDDAYFTLPDALSTESIEFYLQLLSLKSSPLKEHSYIDYLSIRKVPFFITYENFRI